MSFIWSDRAYESSLQRCEAIKSYIASRGKGTNLNDESQPLQLSADGGDEEASSNTTSTKFSSTSVPHDDRNTKAVLDWASLEQSVNIIKTSIRLYGTQGVIVAFNGGKDATIILELYTALLADHYQAKPHLPRSKPRAVYFLEQSSEFRDVQDFVESRRKEFDLDLVVCPGPINEQIVSYMESIGINENLSRSDQDWVKHPAFLLGVRRGDPRSENLAFFEPSSDWIKASFMRVHPILEWNYGMVWDYFDLFRGVYCSLYDQGYTSLGKTGETLPNLHLKALGSLKARDLVDWSRERGGREPVGGDDTAKR